MLMIYMIAGAGIVTFHGDEAMQIHTSRDYWTAFVRGSPDALRTQPPYPIDSDAHLRILNGSLNRHAIGFAWHLAGWTEADLPPPPGWDWGLNYAGNVAAGHRPTDGQMLIARLPSALLLALGVPCLYRIGRLHSPTAGAIAAGLYALNPALLLNGRRAVQEGALLGLGLLALMLAAHIAQRRARMEQVHPLAWLALAGASGVALAGKHSAIAFVAGAWAWLLVAEAARRPFALPRAAGAAARLVGVAALAFGLFVALSPALWDDPAARIGDLLRVRAELLDIQVAVSGNPPLTLPERALMIVREPFLMPLTHFEASWWGVTPEFAAEIARYEASPLAGLRADNLIGVALTALALIGALVCAWRWRREAAFAAGALAWSLIAAASLLANPLAWQRYALPWIPAAILLAAVGAAWCAQSLNRQRRKIE
jgi:hypothetical protein